VVKIRDTVRSTEKVTMDVVSAAARTRLRAVLMTTISTVAGLFPTAYGLAGYDSMLSEMMLAMAWGLITATAITLVLVPVLYSYSLNTKGGLN
jgi:multidrug efflux pump subunit AcrB